MGRYMEEDGALSTKGGMEGDFGQTDDVHTFVCNENKCKNLKDFFGGYFFKFM